MKPIKTLRTMALSLACLGLLIPAPLLRAADAADGREQASTEVADVANETLLPKDVALGPQGRLEGRVVDPQGAPMAGMQVVIWRDRVRVVDTFTDDKGRFVVRGLMPGAYQIVAGDAIGLYRFWSAEAAPPAAQQGILIATDGAVVRGQFGSFWNPSMYGIPPLKFWFGNPIVIGGITAAAITIPVVAHNNRIHRDKVPSSP